MIVFSEDDDQFLDQYNKYGAYTPPSISIHPHPVVTPANQRIEDVIPLSAFDDDASGNSAEIENIIIINSNGKTSTKSNGPSLPFTKNISIPKTKKRSQSSASKLSSTNLMTTNNSNINTTNNINNNDSLKKNKQRDWFESDSSNDDHNHISVLVSPVRKFYQPGDTIDVVVNVNVKKLQCLNATFEGYSSCQLPARQGQDEKPLLVKSKIAATHFHLYPTGNDIQLNGSAKSLHNLSFTHTRNTNNLTDLDSSTNSNSNSNSNSFNSTPTSTTLTNSSNPSSSNSSPENNNDIRHNGSSSNLSAMDKELLKNVAEEIPISNLGKSTSFSSLYISDLGVDEWDIDFDQPSPSNQDISLDISNEEMPDMDDGAAKEPPHIHSCADHLVLSKKKHKFTFQLTLPQNLPPSFAFSKQSKNGVFYRIHLCGLGEMHNKFNRTEHSLIKGFETSIPLTIWNPKCNYLPRQLLLTDNLFCSSETYQSTKNDVHIKARLLIKNFCVIDSAISILLSINNQSSQLIKGINMELVNIQQIHKKSTDNLTVENHIINSNAIQSMKCKNANDYQIQPQGKLKRNITFYLPNNIVPSISLDNLSNSYVIRISTYPKKNNSQNDTLDLPLLIVPSSPSA